MLVRIVAIDEKGFSANVAVLSEKQVHMHHNTLFKLDGYDLLHAFKNPGYDVGVLLDPEASKDLTPEKLRYAIIIEGDK
jgi:hypothetical protein